jgi:PAS domain S-box-containing protein
VRKDGSTFPAYVRNVRIDGPAGCAAVSIDFTERLAAETELRAARDYMRAVSDSMAEGLCTLDQHRLIVFLNPRAEELLGWTTEDLLGENLHEVPHHTHPDGAPFAESECPFVKAIVQRRSARADDDALVRCDGTLLPVDQAMTPFQTRDGVSGFAVVFSDIRERKQLERQAESKLVDLEWIERINHALSHDRLLLFAQPIVEISSRNVLQHELLIRMLDDDDAIIEPGKFLPVAEKYGLIGEIDRWVVRRCIEMAADGYGGELNVSAHSVSDPTFFDLVDAELLRTGADPALLIFELTALVKAVVNLARDFGIKTVAEGVEDADSLTVLEQCGVDYAQGYWIGRPAALEQGIYSRNDNGQ